MKTIGVVTVARSDYGIYLPILRRMAAEPDLRVKLFVGGMHLSPEFGRTVSVIEKDGFEIAERVEMLVSSDTPEGVAKSIGLGVIGFAQAYARTRPDLLLVLGDRFEMLSAVVAALPYAMLIAHIHGGESTEGSIDEAIRHSITKMSHLHFVATEKYRRRVIQMGEHPDRVIFSGAPSLDNLLQLKLLDVEELERRVGMKLRPAPVLVTYHPVTLEYRDTRQHMVGLLDALEEIDRPLIFTYPNADTNGRLVIDAINKFAATNSRTKVLANLGTELYFSLLRHAGAMVGNSSSGIIEAASFKLPVVNIGNRQRGRVHGPNVLDVEYGADEIRSAVKKALSPEFGSSLANLRNPYSEGNASEIIVRTLKSVPRKSKLLLKEFYDLPAAN